MRVQDEVTAFQLGSSTVVTIPKSMGIRPGQKLGVKKTKNGAAFKLEKKESLRDILKRTQGAWADINWEEWDKDQKERRKLELEASARRKKAW